jgi:hypothetical protein
MYTEANMSFFMEGLGNSIPSLFSGKGLGSFAEDKAHDTSVSLPNCGAG